MGYVDAGDSRMTAGSPEKGRKIRFRQPGLIGQGTEGRRLSDLAVCQRRRQELPAQEESRRIRPDTVWPGLMESYGIDGPTGIKDGNS